MEADVGADFVVGCIGQPEQVVHPSGGTALRHLTVHEVLLGHVVHVIPVYPEGETRCGIVLVNYGTTSRAMVGM